MRVATDEDRRAYTVPPAWTDVFATTGDPAKTLVLAVGRDAGGKLQDRRNKEMVRKGQLENWARVAALGDHLPAVDKALAREAGSNPDAAAMLVIRKMALRVGGSGDGRAKAKAYGAATLERRHVQVVGDTVRLRFVGKEGKPNDLKIVDAQLARVLERHMAGKAGGDRMFQTSDAKVRAWLDKSAPGFTPKDFRTWTATGLAQALVRDLPAPLTQADFKRQRNHVGDRVAAVLGNTRKLALDSYADPLAFRPWENSNTISAKGAAEAVNRMATVQDRLAEVARFNIDHDPVKGETPASIRALGGAHDTQEKHTVQLTDGTRAYTAARSAQHDQWIGETLHDAVFAASGGHPLAQKYADGQTLSPQEKTQLRDAIASRRDGPPRALFMAGGAASGKTTALENSPELLPPYAATVNPDDFKDKIPEFQQMVKGKDKYAGTGTHEESADLAKRLQDESKDLGLNVTIDGAGNTNPDKFASKLQEMHDAGYAVDALYVTIPTDEAVVRNVLRAMGNGRWMPEQKLREQHANVSAIFPHIAALPFLGSGKVYDNSGDAPKLIATIHAGSTTVLDNAAFNEFKAKGGPDVKMLGIPKPKGPNA